MVPEQKLLSALLDGEGGYFTKDDGKVFVKYDRIDIHMDNPSCSESPNLLVVDFYLGNDLLFTFKAISLAQLSSGGKFSIMGVEGRTEISIGTY
jgi:hypothetical protein